jgi:hypothetical protein
MALLAFKPCGSFAGSASFSFLTQRLLVHCNRPRENVDDARDEFAILTEVTERRHTHGSKCEPRSEREALQGVVVQ